MALEPLTHVAVCQLVQFCCLNSFVEVHWHLLPLFSRLLVYSVYSFYLPSFYYIAARWLAELLFNSLLITYLSLAACRLAELFADPLLLSPLAAS